MARGQIEKRGQRRRKLKPVILIVTEGSQTEPKYFEHYRSRQTNIDIRVVGSRTKGGETDYLGLIRKAVEYQSKNQISASNGDAVWVVADGDVNYNNPDPIAAKDNLLSRARKLADALPICDAPLGQGLAQELCLGGLAGAVRALEYNQFSAHLCLFSCLTWIKNSGSFIIRPMRRGSLHRR